MAAMPATDPLLGQVARSGPIGRELPSAESLPDRWRAHFLRKRCHDRIEAVSRGDVGTGEPPGSRHQEDYESQWAPVLSIAGMMGSSPVTLWSWVRKAERDQGLRPGLAAHEQQRLKALERESHELRRANEILHTASVLLRPGGARLQTKVIVASIAEQREAHGGRAVLPTPVDRPVHILRAEGQAVRRAYRRGHNATPD